jgi:hypothetical protein
VCPQPRPRSDAARALTGLADAIKAPGPAFPPVPWSVEFASEYSEPDGAVQRAWKTCREPDAMMAFALALYPGAGTFHEDELGERFYATINVAGLQVSFTGAPADVARAIRLHLPAIGWQQAVRP